MSDGQQPNRSAPMAPLERQSEAACFALPHRDESPAGEIDPQLGGAAGATLGGECPFTRSTDKPMETTLSEVALVVVLMLVVILSSKV